MSSQIISSIQEPYKLDPCTATASMFLFTQGSYIICVHHDTLAVARCFSNHTDDIQLLVADAVSENGTESSVISYDTGQTAIVWDCLTGEEVAKLKSYEPLTVAAWMRNGNIAFGNAKGDVILFNPTTSEHVSVQTNLQIPITALAPAADCRTYAIGFSNGTLLIVALQPTFMVLHRLNTSMGSPSVINLAWHASKSRQKSNMLAAQTRDGDIRVWSIVLYPTSTAKMVRVLRRNAHFCNGPNWLGWSKNGRIIQFSESETSSWDVRTKKVSFESVPTLELVKGLAIYGPGATLFTLGPQNTVQQFDLNSPPQMVANVQHSFNSLLSSPPRSLEGQQKQKFSAPTNAVDAETPTDVVILNSDAVNQLSPQARIAEKPREMKTPEPEKNEPYSQADTSSPVSSISFTSTTSSSSTTALRCRGYHRKQISNVSRVNSDETTISAGSSYATHSLSSSFSSPSVTSDNSRAQCSRLRHEIILDDAKVVDLFKFTKARLNDISFQTHHILDHSHLTKNDCRRHILRALFDWDGEVVGLIEDEISRHPPGSISRLLLAKWLGDIDPHIISTRSESMTPSDWMFLALSGISRQMSQVQVVLSYVHRLLKKDDIHTAATIMIGMGDHHDAVEVYLSHNKFMEAVILTCLVFPSDLQRQVQLVRSWGEWAVLNNQRQFAIRCFACTGSEFAESWFRSNSPTTTPFQPQGCQKFPSIMSPPLSPPGAFAQNSATQSPALKIITSLGHRAENTQFPDQDDDDMTPMNSTHFSSVQTEANISALPRESQHSASHTSVSARTATPGGFRRQLLPAIGEMPSDVLSQEYVEPARISTPVAVSSFDQKKSEHAVVENIFQPGMSKLDSSIERAPKATPTTPIPGNLMRSPLPLLSPPELSLSISKQRDTLAKSRSPDQKSEVLPIQHSPIESMTTDKCLTTLDSSMENLGHQKALNSFHGSAAIPSMAAETKIQPLITSRIDDTASLATTGSLEEYIRSLELAQQHAKQLLQQGKQSFCQGKVRGLSRQESSYPRESCSAPRYTHPENGMSTSPSAIPQEPQDLEVISHRTHETLSPVAKKKNNASQIKLKLPLREGCSSSLERLSDTIDEKNPGGCLSYYGRCPRQPSFETMSWSINATRGRILSREGSAMRSPSSPLPLSPQLEFFRDEDCSDRSDKEKPFGENHIGHLVSFWNNNLLSKDIGFTSTHGFSSEKRDSDRSRCPRQNSKRVRLKKEAFNHFEKNHPIPHVRSLSDFQARDLRTNKNDYFSKKEQAARELEERRQSLARRPLAPPIIHPEELARLSSAYRRTSPAQTNPLDIPHPRSHTTPPSCVRNFSPRHAEEGRGEAGVEEKEKCSGTQIGLPATPRAMKLLNSAREEKNISCIPLSAEKFKANKPRLWDNLSVRSYFNADENLPSLPQTTYKAPRRSLLRSASAPIPEEPLPSPVALPSELPTHPAFQAALPPSSGRRGLESRVIGTPPSQRKVNPGESQPGTLGYQTRNNQPIKSRDHVDTTSVFDDKIGTAPQPANLFQESLASLNSPPPILQELQHLARPPPPPPPPALAPHFRPDNPNTVSIVSGISSGSGIIEIIMDDQDIRSVEAIESTIEAPLSQTQRHYNHSYSHSEDVHMVGSRFMRAPSRHGSPPVLWFPGRSKNMTMDDQLASSKPIIQRNPREYESAIPDMEGGMI